EQSYLDDELFEERNEAWMKKRKLKPPEISKLTDNFPLIEEVKRVNLYGSRLQVIVKIASIILTPENSKYPGGQWHIEGTPQENIICSAIYYLSSENITESSLAFRQSICDPRYEQNDDQG